MHDPRLGKQIAIKCFTGTIDKMWEWTEFR